MFKPTHYSPAARSYAEALFELASERQQSMEQIRDELGDLKKIIDENPLFGQFLTDPAITTSQRTDVLERAIRGRVSPLTANFLGLLNQKGRMGLLTQVADAYKDLLDEKFGNVEVDLTVAQRLDDGQVEQVRQQVSRALGKNAIVRQSVDDSIIGGLVLRVEDRLIVASVRSQLQSIRHKLLAGRPRAAAWTTETATTT
jgi:F-type H+-transporting ATPase subunit delta